MCIIKGLQSLIPKTYVALVLDRSGSMGNLRKPVVDAFNSQLKVLREQSEDQDVRLSIYQFGSSLETKGFDVLPQRVRPMVLSDYDPSSGSTALHDAIGNVIEDLHTVRDAKDSNVSFMVIVLTDGEENSSREFTANEVGVMIKRLQRKDNWTFVFQVPPGSARQIQTLYNVPAGNIREWESTTRGLAETYTQTNSGLGSYFQGRSAGVKSVQSFYVQPDLSALKTRDVADKLNDLRSHYRVLKVDSEQPIREFVEDELNRGYRVGEAFYQLTKTEKVQPSKEILLMEKNKSSVFGGNAARSLIGLPYGAEAKVEPGNHANYDIFVQSTSTNRKLVRGTKLLVKR